MTPAAALTFAIFSVIGALFQLALACGAPWGSLAMGGLFPGSFPPVMRLLALVQMGVLAGFAVIVLSAAGVILTEWHAISRDAIWIVVAFCVLSVIANLATRSKWERRIWAPVAVILAFCSSVVALS